MHTFVSCYKANCNVQKFPMKDQWQIWSGRTQILKKRILRFHLGKGAPLSPIDSI